ncbi:hypothetical protein [Marinobacter sp. 3-2]|nr:hypothetical protein [Marinobacter sp. 3-2]
MPVTTGGEESVAEQVEGSGHSPGRRDGENDRDTEGVSPANGGMSE